MKYNRFVSKCIVVFDLNLFLPLVILLGLLGLLFFLKAPLQLGFVFDQRENQSGKLVFFCLVERLCFAPDRLYESQPH